MNDEPVKGRDLLLCPECGEWMPHFRGYITEHQRNIQRGELTTGSTFCDGSNSRPKMNLKTITFTGMCLHCLSTVRREFRETFPGSLDTYGGLITVQCECGFGGNFCSNCDQRLHLAKSPNIDAHLLQGIKDALVQGGSTNVDKDAEELLALAKQAGEDLKAANPQPDIWVDEQDSPECPDGATHQIVDRQQEDRPVLLTDNHVVVEADEGPVPGGQS